MKKIVFSVLLSLTLTVYAQDTDFFNKISKELKQLITTTENQNKVFIEKVFILLNLDVSLLENNHLKNKMGLMLYLCKRDSKCQLSEGKERFKKLANGVYGRTRLLSDVEINKLYTAVDGIDYIFNKLVNKNIINIKSNNDLAIKKIIYKILEKSNQPNLVTLINEVFVFYDYDFSSSKILKVFYGLDFLECIKAECPKNNRKKYPANDVMAYRAFFKDIERINNIVKQEKALVLKQEVQKKILAERKAYKSRQVKLNTLNTIAKNTGFSSYSSGLSKLINDLKLDFVSLDYAKKNLWQQDEYDNFIVDSITDKYVIYRDKKNSEIKIGTKKQPNIFYPKNAKLNSDLYFKISKVQEFKTILGLTQQILIIKIIKISN